MNRSRSKHWKVRLLAIGVALILAWSLSEGLLALVSFSFPTFYQTDPLTGVRAIPGSRGWYALEGRGYVQFNSKGWRDKERPLEKRAGEIRIAVLGDSFTEAKQVNLEKTFPFRLEQKLQQATGQDIQVFNFGVAGFGSAQQLLVLEHHVLNYRPDIVLLAFYSGNDVSDNSRSLRQTEYIPYFVLNNGQLELDDRFLSSAEYRRRGSTFARAMSWATSYSRLLQLANLVRYKWRLGRMSSTSQVQEVGLSDAIFLPPRDEVVRQAWAVTEAILARMEEVCKEQGIEFCIVTVSNSIQVHPDSQRRDDAMNQLGVSDLFYPDRRLRRWGEKHGVRVLNLAEPMAIAASQDHVFFHGFGAAVGEGHWNEAGHEFAANLIAEWLRLSPTLSSR